MRLLSLLLLLSACPSTLFEAPDVFCSSDTDCLASQVCARSAGVALGRCGEACGNGTLEAGEACDDGNRDDADSCLNNCQPAVCGDGVLRMDLAAGQTAAEACDDGNTDFYDACTTGCLLAVCGDGFQRSDLSSENDDYEACDDGNNSDRDECTTACAEPRCGDGLTSADEACDDGNDDNSDACLRDCTLAICGDGIVQSVDGVEACDDENEDNSDACVNCALAVCGDRHVQSGVEACDDGNDINEDECLTNCDAAACGDGVVGPGETCDDANEDNDDGCTTLCAAARCGDGLITSGELCDDGNNEGGDTCGPDCAFTQRCFDATGGEGDEQACIRCAGTVCNACRQVGGEQVCVEVMRLAGGLFNMGAPGEPRVGNGNNKWNAQFPRHEVQLSPFYIAKTETTNLSFAACERHANCLSDAAAVGSDTHPRTGLTQSHARQFCRFLGADLPTEAQWEFTATNGGVDEFPWGLGGPTCDRANSNGVCAGNYGMRPVCTNSSGLAATDGANSAGVCDLIGNAMEYTLDRIIIDNRLLYPYDHIESWPQDEWIDPLSVMVGQPQVILRGGYAFNTSVESYRSTYRHPYKVHEAGNTGFRCVWHTVAPIEWN
jgi:cysteine-rich repeat protein